MKRIYWLLGIVVLLGLGYLALQLSSQGKEQGTYVSGSTDFKVANTEKISKVFLADRKGNKTTLTRSGEGWLVDGEHPANPNTVKNLMQAIGQIEMQYIPNRKATPNIIKSLATNGILVEIFEADDRKVKGYYIGGSTSDERGTFAIMEGADDPYVVHIPNWVGNIRFRYNLVGDDWRSKQVFGEAVEDIAKVSVEYPTRRNLSFILEKAGEEYKLSPFYDTDQPVRPVPRGRAERYLVQYEKLYVSSYQNQAKEEKVELNTKIPFATIRLTLNSGEEKNLKVYPRFDERTITADPKTGEVIDETKLRGYNLLANDGKDFAVIQTQDMEPFMATYQYF